MKRVIQVRAHTAADLKGQGFAMADVKTLLKYIYIYTVCVCICVCGKETESRHQKGTSSVTVSHVDKQLLNVSVNVAEWVCGLLPR